MGRRTREKRREIAEDFGILFEQMSFPRVAGRIWGWLLTCDPPRQTAAELAEAVHASRGSVSTMTRLLIQIGAMEKVGVPGERSGYYRLRSGGFTEILRARMRLIAELRRLAEHGLDILASESAETKKNLEEYRDLCLFFEKEFPALIGKWERRRAKR